MMFAGAYCATKDYACKENYDNYSFLSEVMGENALLCLCGRINFTMLHINQDVKTEKYDNMVLSSQGDVNLKYLGKGNGYGYGIELGAKADSGVVKRGNTIIRKFLLFFEEDRIGVIQLGYVNTAADVFSICGDKFLAGYLGPGSGNLPAFYNTSAGSIVCPGFPGNDAKAAKIVWLSPVFSGVSAGLSFTPDSRDVGPFKTQHHQKNNYLEKADFFGLKRAYSKNVATIGLAYERGAPDELNAKISVAGWLGKGKSGMEDDRIEVRNVAAWNVGFTVCCKDWRTSFGYMDSGKSLLSKKFATQEISDFDGNRNYLLSDPDVGIRSGADAGKIYSLGIAYSLWRELIISCGYFHSVMKFSENEKATANIFTMAAEYSFGEKHPFGKNLSIYIEYNYIRTDSCARARAYGKSCNMSSTGKNSANIIMVGGKCLF
ncbi:MAG: porin [Holosporaceae bacterium]|nr:porin [Holosporaceae bacterium]